MDTHAEFSAVDKAYQAGDHWAVPYLGVAYLTDEEMTRYRAGEPIKVSVQLAGERDKP